MDDMRVLNRAGFTLHEMIIALAVTGFVVALASSAALGQLRFFRGIGEVTALRTQIGHAAAISANVLNDVANASDIVVATDSALEAHVTIGVASACGDDIARVTVPAASDATGNTLGSFSDTPQTGDAVHVTVEDSARTTWMRLHARGAASAGGNCGAFPDVLDSWVIPLLEPLAISSGAAVRITRRMRLTLYRASDNRWYLGLREWNGEGGQFNTVQPVAGPLRSRSADPNSTGLLFRFHDAAGTALPEPVDVQRVASISVVARSESIRPVRAAGLHSKSAPLYADSVVIAVALRNQP